MEQSVLLMPSKLWLQLIIFAMLAFELLVALRILANQRHMRLAKVISIETQLVVTVTEAMDAYIRAHPSPPTSDNLRRYGENMGVLTVGVLTRHSDIRLSPPVIEITEDSIGYYVLVRGKSVKNNDISRPLRINLKARV